VHGVLLILVFTITFLIGYFYAGVSHTLGGLLPRIRKMGWISFGLIMAGVALAASQIIIGEASVLYTFYPPLAASGWFYVGLLLVVLGIWTAAIGVFINVFVWRKQNRGQVIPHLSYFSTWVFILSCGDWGDGAVGVYMVIPWAFGVTEGNNVLVSHTVSWGVG